MLVNIINRYPPLPKWDKKPDLCGMVSDSFVGIEVEVEGIRTRDSSFIFWSGKEDGSLRNGGREYVTHPIPAIYAPEALEELQEFLTTRNPNHVFTNRTSIHIHLNVRDLSFKQLHAFSLVYVLVEKAFYRFAGRDRYKNIFCVPHADSIDYQTVAKLMDYAKDEDALSIDDFIAIRNEFDRCRRYVGFNVKSVVPFGTVEFRHLRGTMDKEVITTWINLILSIKKYVMETPYDNIIDTIHSINTTSQYEQLLSRIFGEHKIDIMYEGIEKDMYSALLYIKETLNAKRISILFLEQSSDKVISSSFVTKFTRQVEEGPRKKAPKDIKTIVIDENDF